MTTTKPQNTQERAAILRALRAARDELAAQYGVTRLGLFGSVARGESTDTSDVDIVVEMEPNLFGRAALKVDLEQRLARHVDVVRYRPGMNARLRERIDREAVYA